MKKIIVLFVSFVLLVVVICGQNCVPCSIMGDLNCDNTINIKDLTMLGNAIMADDFLPNGDLNGNFKMENLDYCAEIQLVLTTVAPDDFPYQPGDLNGDAEINVLDLTLLNNYISSFSTPSPIDVIVGDMNGDCVLDDNDSKILVMLILEQINQEDLPY